MVKHYEMQEGDALRPEIESALRMSVPKIPAGFARGAAIRFAAAHARKRMRRLYYSAAALFVGVSLFVWMTLLNIGQVGDAAWDGLLAGVAMVRSVFTLWQHIPVFGVFFAVVGMLLTLVLGGVVSKLDRRLAPVK